LIEFDNNKKTNTFVVCPYVFGQTHRLSEESRLQEAIGLSLAINIEVVASQSVKIKNIKPATYFSKGFIEETISTIKNKDIELLIVDTKLSPIQQRNLEKELKIKVIDRTALILEIFGERAQTKEGVLQVELAHLTYQRSRLVRSWTHLERQRGGAGFLGGPGETQIELDRRIIDDKIIKIKKELEKVKKTRFIQRSARQKVPYPIVALVGYTNAGKSTLFNYLSNSNVMAENMLFATLDPTMRKIILPSGKEVILSDTVGFISDLPHELVMAFRATLEEVLNANIILHIRDISNEDNASQCADVLDVLHNLGLNEIQSSDNYIEVFNKCDLLDTENKILWDNKTNVSKSNVLVSAYTGSGCNRLLEIIDEKLSKSNQVYEITIPASEGKILSWIYENSEVSRIENIDNSNILTTQISPENISRLINMCEIIPNSIIRKLK
jgi:GTP-binding protein HflX